MEGSLHIFRLLTHQPVIEAHTSIKAREGLVANYVSDYVFGVAALDNRFRVNFGKVRDLGRVLRITIASTRYNRDDPPSARVICQKEIVSCA